MKNVVITGRGIISPIGNGLAATEEALRAGTSGTVLFDEWKEIGLDSHVAGLADNDPECPLLDKKRKRFTSANSRMAVAAAYQAIQEAGLYIEDLKNMRVAIVTGCAGSAYEEVYNGAKAFMESGKVKKVKPFTVPRVMPSSAASNLSLALGISGECYSVNSACSSGTHSLLLAKRLLDSGAYDIVLAGGSEEVNWVHALGFNALRALSKKYNDNPSIASRPFDRDRDGFVISEGAGILILENAEHAAKRNAKPIAAISGVAANSNAQDMVLPIAESSAKVMEMAIKDAGLTPEDISYINTHGTATAAGDPVEIAAIKKVFWRDEKNVAINSTKSMTGHLIGAAGAVEAIFCTIMMQNNFICPTINLDNPEPEFAWADLVRETREDVLIKHCISNSFGFGGSNASLVFSKPE